MIILGIDPGIATIGWGVIKKEGATSTVVDYGHISTPKTLTLAERLVEIHNDLLGLLEKFQPEEAAVEELFFYNNQKTAIDVAQARGVILLTLEQNRVKVAGYTPLEVKQALTNYGAADKRQVQEMVRILLNLSVIPKPDDTADALAIALCHSARRTFDNHLTQ
jgi:crossover junction endodeoxyribonuclease RuvC